MRQIIVDLCERLQHESSEKDKFRSLLRELIEDGDLEIDNGATERANRDVAIGSNNWTFLGCGNGGKTTAILISSRNV